MAPARFEAQGPPPLGMSTESALAQRQGTPFGQPWTKRPG